MGRSQLGKTTASVSSYWALLHHYKEAFFLLFFDIRKGLNSEGHSKMVTRRSALPYGYSPDSFPFFTSPMA
jgi:hypothetical protein